MRSRHKAALIVLSLAFAAGLFHVVTRQLSMGGGYAPYSTFRSDPLGARIFFESLRRLPGLEVSRNTLPLDSFRGRGVTLFVLGVYPDPWALDAEGADLERTAREGGRVVIAFQPVWPILQELAEKKGEKPKEHAPGLIARNGMELKRAVAKSKEEIHTGIPRSTALYLRPVSKDWTILRHDSAKLALLAERRVGDGSIVLIADSWRISNDALATAPDAGGLAELAGPHRRIVFDETFLGSEETGTVMGLIRRYNLHGVILVSLILAGLFVWKQSWSFLPPEAADAASIPVKGRSSRSGMVDLLRRGVPLERLIETCVAQWNVHGAKIETPAGADPVIGYAAVRAKLEAAGLLRPKL